MGLGLAIGPLAGGLLLSRFSWGSVFFVNVPVVAVGTLAAWPLVPESKNPAAERADPIGSMLSIGGLGLLLRAIIEAPTDGWTSPGVVAGRDRWDRHAARVRRLGGP
jgi:MFS family permease